MTRAAALVAAAGLALLPGPATSGFADPYVRTGGVDLGGTGSSIDPVAVAPDGRTAALLTEFPDRLTIAPLDGGAATGVPVPNSQPGFDPVRAAVPPVAWTSDGRAVWAETRDVVLPSHFFRSGLRPILVSRAGHVTALPPLRSPAGPLDALQWVGHRGLALALFGTSGDFYRPPHPDPAPELALVDARRGRVLARLPMKGIASRYAIRWATGVELPDGRVRVLLAIGGRPGEWRLIRWTQGEAPVIGPYPATPIDGTRALLLPDGRTLLLAFPLRPDGIDPAGGACEIWSRRPCNLPPPRPRTGPVLERRDAATGRLVWRITATAAWFGGSATVLAAGENLAVVSYPAAADGARLAVVRLADGRIRQLLTSSAGQAGFADGDRLLWLHANGVELYRRR